MQVQPSFSLSLPEILFPICTHAKGIAYSLQSIQFSVAKQVVTKMDFSPKLECSNDLIGLCASEHSTPEIREKIYQSLFMLCDEIGQVDMFLARLYGQGALKEDPIELRELHPDPAFRIMYALHAVKKANAITEVVVALERSGNEEIIAALLHRAKPELPAGYPDSGYITVCLQSLRRNAKRLQEEFEGPELTAARAQQRKENAASLSLSTQALCPESPDSLDLPEDPELLDGPAASSKIQDIKVDVTTQIPECDILGGDELLTPTFSSACSSVRIAPDNESPTHIYVATRKGIQAFCLATSEVRAVTTEEVYGIAYDPRGKKIYMSSGCTLKRSSIDGSDAETVFYSGGYGGLRGLSIDSHTGNLYAVTATGSLLMFGLATIPLTCSEIVSNSGLSFSNPIFDSKAGRIYFTTWKRPGIWCAETNGSSLLAICSGDLTCPCGIAIDLDDSKIYWTDYTEETIKSSDFEGGSVQTLVQLPSGSKPHGIVYWDGRIYWGTANSGCLQSCDSSGQVLLTHFTDIPESFQIALVSQESVN